ncbi:MAG: nitroreductase family protein [Alphaproteobacteria bacterium]|nr:nitroreductase family protein [Alphaproteobacteria bacterium]
MTENTGNSTMNTNPSLATLDWHRGDAVPAASFIATLRGRHSIRRYTEEPVSAELIETLLRVAIQAPSAHNRQPWRFHRILDSERVDLANAMAARLRQDRVGDGDPIAAVEADLARSYARMTTSPAIILVSLSMQDMDRYRDARRNQAEYLMAVQSVAMAGQNLLLAAHASGLGACWVAAPLFCPDTVAAVLNLPPDWQPQGMITLGYPEGAATIRSRHPLEACTRS